MTEIGIYSCKLIIVLQEIMYYLYLCNNPKESGENTSQRGNCNNPHGIPLIKIIIFIYFVGEARLSGKEDGNTSFNKREMSVSFLEVFLVIPNYLLFSTNMNILNQQNNYSVYETNLVEDLNKILDSVSRESDESRNSQDLQDLQHSSKPIDSNNNTEELQKSDMFDNSCELQTTALESTSHTQSDIDTLTLQDILNRDQTFVLPTSNNNNEFSEVDVRASIETNTSRLPSISKNIIPLLIDMDNEKYQKKEESDESLVDEGNNRTSGLEKTMISTSNFKSIRLEEITPSTCFDFVTDEELQRLVVIYQEKVMKEENNEDMEILLNINEV